MERLTPAVKLAVQHKFRALKNCGVKSFCLTRWQITFNLKAPLISSTKCFHKRMRRHIFLWKWRDRLSFGRHDGLSSQLELRLRHHDRSVQDSQFDFCKQLSHRRNSRSLHLWLATSKISHFLFCSFYLFIVEFESVCDNIFVKSLWKEKNITCHFILIQRVQVQLWNHQETQKMYRD